MFKKKTRMSHPEDKSKKLNESLPKSPNISSPCENVDVSQVSNISQESHLAEYETSSVINDVLQEDNKHLNWKIQ